MSELLAASALGSEVEGDVFGFLRGNSTRSGELNSVSFGNWSLAETHRQDVPLGGHRTFKNERWIAAFAGDLVDVDSVPFERVLSALESGHTEVLAGLNGIFAFVAFDRRNKRFFCVSDRRSQKPLFYRPSAPASLVSTSLAAFVRASEAPAFDERWLWQCLYFNFPVDDTTFLVGVKRMPAASIMTFDERSGELAMTSYADSFRATEPMLRGRAALERAKEVFGDRLGEYYRFNGDIACALTGGWDGRTLLGLAPSQADVTAYTYGGPGCEDLVAAADTAARLGVRHLEIPFTASFVEQLPHHAFETVYLSSGMQGVLRASLHHVYEQLTDSGQRFPLTISGISLGTQLRGAAQFPDLISEELANRFRGRGAAHGSNYWRAIVGEKHAEFDEFIASRCELLETRFGSFESPAHHLAFVVYPASAHYFCGELAVSDHFTTVRVPAWDSQLIELNYSTEHSTLSLSRFVPGNDRARAQSMVLQAYLLREFSPELFQIPVRGIHPGAVLSGEAIFQLERAYRAVGRRLRSRAAAGPAAPLENWSDWLFEQNRPFISELLQSSDTLIGNYVEVASIDKIVDNRDMRLLGKLLTTEIVLRLITTAWQRFW